MSNRESVLDEIVHDVASERASNICNASQHENWLLALGWATAEIEAEVARRLDT